MAGKMRLDFGNLPLIEAAVRVSLVEPITLRFSSINDIHNRIRDSFPNISEPEHYEVAPGVRDEVAVRPGLITGVVFKNNQTGLRATVQSRVVVVRWTQLPRGGSPPYPRYAPVLRDAVWQVVDAVRCANKADAIPVAVVNMSYINAIRVADFSSVLRTYFSDDVQVKVLEGADEVRKVELSWKKGSAEIRFKLEKVSVPIDEGNIVVCHLTTVSGINVAEARLGEKEALDQTHDRLQQFFADVLSDHAKKEWKLEILRNA